jgi:hypothetical protein
MNEKRIFHIRYLAPVLAVLLLGLSGTAFAGHTGIDGLTGTTFSFTARADHISTADGGSYLIWGYADDGNSNAGRAQYPGPTLIVNQGDTITVTLKNTLPEPVSIVFPGQTGVTASGGAPGVLTNEAPGDNATTVTYSFVAREPGTYIYQSGTHMDLQVEMGLVGALIVRPALGANYAYNHVDTRWDREYLFFITEMDPRVHQAVEFGTPFNNTDYFAVYWFLNGRVAPDNMGQPKAPWFPTQPYNSVPRMHPGERLLMRVVGAGRDLHPFHHHGNHATIIARDGRLLSSAPGSGPDLGEEGFTIQVVPGQTADALFTWTGKGLGWDIYGTPADGRPAHDCVDGDADGFADPSVAGNNPWEYCADHGKRFPVVLPELQDLTFGAWYGGSPFMGTPGALPPGEGGLNPNGGFSYMWHSHTEKELTNFDIFPGGLLTMLIIEPWTVDIP